MSGYLLVRAGREEYGLPLEAIEQVIPAIDLLPAPATLPAVRGVVPLGGRLVPLVHLAALLTDGVPPDRPAGTAVIARIAGRPVALEVDEALHVEREAPLPVPAGWELPWALGVARRGGALIPVVDLAALGERLMALAKE